MFFTLVWKECTQILKSLVYYIYVVIFVLFISSQMGATEQLKEPQPGQEYYGLARSENEKDIIERTLADLYEETSRNSYATYPMGFYKGVTLSERELEQVQKLIEECSESTFQDLSASVEEHYSKFDSETPESAMQAQAEFRIPADQNMSYEDFCEVMDQVCSVIGSGSAYERKSFEARTEIPQTYEGAMEEFQATLEMDQVTGAAARLFCDYAGIMLAILPIFLGVTRCLRDKRAQVSQVIYARKGTSLTIIGSRYLATVLMAFLPVVVIAFVYQMPYQYQAQTLGAAVDNLAFLKYSLLWLLPEIMAVLAVSFCITEFTDTILSIFVQVFWAGISLFSAIGLQGNFGLNLIARWNTFGDAQWFLQQKAELFWNRGCYAVLSLLLVVLTVAIYEKKRREGETLYGKIYKHRR